MDSHIFKTIVYKTVDACQIKLDLYIPASAIQTPAPVLLRLHGGGLLQGNRGGVPPHMLRGISKYNYALISADYRLAPQVGAADILSDVLDCLSFIRNNLRSHVDKDSLIDTTNIAVVGSSAGGYLALLAAVYARPKPQVVMAIYPITNPLGSFFVSPQAQFLGRLERDVVAKYLDKDGEVESEPATDSARNKMFHWMLQEAAAAELYGIKQDDNKHVVAAAVRKYGKAGLPPIFVVHGDKDRLCGVEQSDEVIEAFRDIGAVYEYERLEGLDHLFDRDGKVQLEGMYRFMQRYV